MVKFLLQQKQIDLSLPNKLGNLSFEAYAEAYGNDDIASMVEQQYLKSKNFDSPVFEMTPNPKGSNMFLTKTDEKEMNSDSQIE